LRPLFTLSLFVGLSAGAQTIQVIDSKTKRPIKEAFVYSQNNLKGAITNTKGEFDLNQFDDNDLITINHLRYDIIQFKKIDVQNNQITLTEKLNQLPTVYFDHPLRYTMDRDDEPGQTTLLKAEMVKLENPPTTADMLQNSGEILVQKSQGGGGSPIIRGFEANKILLVVDGVRMNNAIYRSGHLQSAITVDNGILDHTEIIYGPSSSLYGSDALGGVIHFHTKDPKITNSDSAYFNGSSYVRYNTNNRSMTGHFDFETGKNKWGLLSSITASKFGDTYMGKNRVLHGDTNWGLHPNVVVQVPSGDTMVTNQNPNLQAFSGYSQFDFLEKFVLQSNAHLKYTFNLQFSTSSKINRYDQLTTYSGGELRYAEWYYGPQTRFLGQFKVDFSKNPNNPKNKLFHSGVFSLAYQRVDEDRISRRFQSDTRSYQLEDVNVISLNLDFNRNFTKNRILFYGLEAQHNIVTSTAYTQNIYTTLVTDDQTRYPNASNYLSSGIYVQYKQKFKNKSSLTAGLRYSFIYAQSDFTDTSFIQLPFNDVQITTGAPSGNLGYILRPDSLTKINFLGTMGFRAPNIDDYGKVFEKSGVTVVPNDQLKPEYAFGAETGFQRTFGKEYVTLGASFYATYLINAMVQRDFTLNGQDSIFYGGENTKIQAIVNTDDAIVYGASAFLKVNFTEKLSFDYTYSYTKGTDLANNTPLEHIPPQFGKIAITYADKKINTALYTFYNFRKNLADYAPGGDNIDLTPNEAGTPPWWTLNYRIGYEFFETLTLQFAVENILDVHYMQFASGISGTGRNFMFSLKADF
jgi:hemoglobin/transferrin/lactoferrin receptor protein